MKLALTALCENPNRKTGLTTMFQEFLGHSLRLYPDLEWVIFAGPTQDLGIEDRRIRYVRDYAANDQMKERLKADHFKVAPTARQLGAQALLTIGFVPLRKSVPTVMHVNSLQHLSKDNRIGALRQMYRVWMMRRGVAASDLIITNSNFAAGQLLAVFPQVKSKLVVSYEGTQPQYTPERKPGETERLKKELGVDPGYLLWVSNFYHYKQAPLLIEGYALLPEKVRAEMPIVMVGGDWDGGLAAAKATAERCGVLQNLRLLGWAPEDLLPPLYRHSTAFCLPSREETFGRCTTEAMSCGTPCLLNDIPIMHEIAGDAALIIDFRDAPSVAKNLLQLHEDAELRQRLRDRGLKQAARFSFEKLTRERIDAIRACLQRKAS